MLFIELADLGKREIVAMLLQVEEELLFQWCRVLEDSRDRILAAGLDGLASANADEKLDVGLVLAVLEEAA